MSEKQNWTPEHGQRCAVYWYDGRFVGEIIQISREGSTGVRLRVRFDSGVIKWAHIRQCRRLVKRERRRVFIHSRVWARPLPGIELGDIGMAIGDEPAPPGWLEFVEVRRK